jgi:pilus assembly protein CpaB
MMRRRGFLLVTFSLAMGLLSAWAANSWVQGRLADDADDGNVAVVAAAMEIPYGTKLTERHLRTVSLPLEAIPEGAVSELEAAIDMVTTANVERGELLNMRRLAAHEQGSTLAALIEENMRAITVRVDDVVGVAGFLLPGNRVDVVSARIDMRSKRAKTETILQNLKVLAVDQTATTEQDEPVIVRAVTLEVKPDQSEILVKAQQEGTIQLTLRNPLEEEVAFAPTPAPRVAAPVRAPVRSSPRPSSSTIQVIRGTTVNNEKARI